MAVFKNVVKLIWCCYIIFALLFTFQHFAILWICPERVGCRPLGNNLYLLDWKDGKPSIVYGTVFKNKLCCDGIPVVPDTLVSIAAEYVTNVEKHGNQLYVADSLSVSTILEEYVHDISYL